MGPRLRYGDAVLLERSDGDFLAAARFLPLGPSPRAFAFTLEPGCGTELVSGGQIRLRQLDGALLLATGEGGCCALGTGTTFELLVQGERRGAALHSGQTVVLRVPDSGAFLTARQTAAGIEAHFAHTPACPLRLRRFRPATQSPSALAFCDLFSLHDVNGHCLGDGTPWVLEPAAATQDDLGRALCERDTFRLRALTGRYLGFNDAGLCLSAESCTLLSLATSGPGIYFIDDCKRLLFSMSGEAEGKALSPRCEAEMVRLAPPTLGLLLLEHNCITELQAICTALTAELANDIIAELTERVNSFLPSVSELKSIAVLEAALTAAELALHTPHSPPLEQLVCALLRLSRKLGASPDERWASELWRWACAHPFAEKHCLRLLLRVSPEECGLPPSALAAHLPHTRYSAELLRLLHSCLDNIPVGDAWQATFRALLLLDFAPPSNDAHTEWLRLLAALSQRADAELLAALRERVPPASLLALARVSHNPPSLCAAALRLYRLLTNTVPTVLWEWLVRDNEPLSLDVLLELYALCCNTACEGETREAATEAVIARARQELGRGAPRSAVAAFLHQLLPLLTPASLSRRAEHNFDALLALCLAAGEVPLWERTIYLLCEFEAGDAPTPREPPTTAALIRQVERLPPLAVEGAPLACPQALAECILDETREDALSAASLPVPLLLHKRVFRPLALLARDRRLAAALLANHLDELCTATRAGVLPAARLLSLLLQRRDIGHICVRHLSQCEEALSVAVGAADGSDYATEALIWNALEVIYARLPDYNAAGHIGEWGSLARARHCFSAAREPAPRIHRADGHEYRCDVRADYLFSLAAFFHAAAPIHDFAALAGALLRLVEWRTLPSDYCPTLRTAVFRLLALCLSDSTQAPPCTDALTLLAAELPRLVAFVATPPRALYLQRGRFPPHSTLATELVAAFADCFEAFHRHVALTEAYRYEEPALAAFLRDAPARLRSITVTPTAETRDLCQGRALSDSVTLSLLKALGTTGTLSLLDECCAARLASLLIRRLPNIAETESALPVLLSLLQFDLDCPALHAIVRLCCDRFERASASSCLIACTRAVERARQVPEWGEARCALLQHILILTELAATSESSSECSGLALLLARTPQLFASESLARRAFGTLAALLNAEPSLEGFPVAALIDRIEFTPLDRVRDCAAELSRLCALLLQLCPAATLDAAVLVELTKAVGASPQSAVWLLAAPPPLDDSEQQRVWYAALARGRIEIGVLEVSYLDRPVQVYFPLRPPCRLHDRHLALLLGFYIRQASISGPIALLSACCLATRIRGLARGDALVDHLLSPGALTFLRLLASVSLFLINVFALVHYLNGSALAGPAALWICGGLCLLLEVLLFVGCLAIWLPVVEAFPLPPRPRLHTALLLALDHTGYSAPLAVVAVSLFLAFRRPLFFLALALACRLLAAFFSRRAAALLAAAPRSYALSVGLRLLLALYVLALVAYVWFGPLLVVEVDGRRETLCSSLLHCLGSFLLYGLQGRAGLGALLDYAPSPAFALLRFAAFALVPFALLEGLGPFLLAPSPSLPEREEDEKAHSRLLYVLWLSQQPETELSRLERDVLTQARLCKSGWMRPLTK